MSEFQVAALGNAIVDVIAEVDEGFLEEFDIPKGGMDLIDTERAEAVTKAFSDTVLVAGGSAGNTCACIASFGGTARFIGTVADDELGTAYRKSMTDAGVVHATPPLTDGSPTGRCLISVTPDAERSMLTYLGAAGEIHPHHVLDGDFETAQVCFLEGYNFEAPHSRAACVEAATRAKAAGKLTAMTMSDKGMVERQFEPLKEFLIDKIDIIFANKLEAEALTGESDPIAATKAIRKMCDWGAVTLSGEGSLVFGPEGDIVKVDAIVPTALVDTTGAGDAYAAGWFFGFTNKMSLDACGKLGALAASEVISHKGARPEVSLLKLAQQKGLLS